MGNMEKLGLTMENWDFYHILGQKKTRFGSENDRQSAPNPMVEQFSTSVFEQYIK